MKKGIIIVNAYCKLPSMLNQAYRLKEEFNLLGVSVDVIENGYDTFVNENGEIISNLSSVDFCVYLDKDKYLATMLEKNGVKTFNSISSISVCDDKMQTVIELSGNGIKVPTTFSSPLNYTGAEVPKSELSKVANVLGYPLIVKLSYSSLGKGVYLVNDINEFYNVVNENKNQAKIYQQFISSSYGTDIRIICIGKKYVSAMKRKSETDFRSNAELGGKGYAFTPNEEFIRVAEKVANILNLDYMGIDLLIGKNGEPIVCEVNSNAFFGVMEQVSGVNVAKKYAEYIIETIYEKKEQI